MQHERNWIISLLDRLSAAAYQSGHHDGVHKGYLEFQQLEKLGPDFHTKRSKFQDDMSNALEATYTEPLSSYGDLMDKVNEDDIDSLRLLLDPAEETGEE
ncbi:hypothetical protein Hanom_Chr00s001459g01682521 [Helianthus anomalus]